LRSRAIANRIATRTQAERRAATRSELLNAAEGLIADRGFAAASLDAIAETAGVSKGALYHHFESKDDLLLSLLERRFQERIDAGARIDAEAGRAAPARLVEEIPFDRRWNLLFMEFVIRAARDKDFRHEFRKRLERLRANSARGIARYLERAGIVTELSSDALATIVAALGNGLAIEALTSPDQSTDPLHASGLALMLEGAAGRSARRQGKRPRSTGS
jgi:AcrR family transcriptional regulator